MYVLLSSPKALSSSPPAQACLQVSHSLRRWDSAVLWSLLCNSGAIAPQASIPGQRAWFVEDLDCRDREGHMN